MNHRQTLLIGSSLLFTFALACSSSDRSVFSPTGGSSGAAVGGTSSAGAGASSAVGGASAGEAPQGGEPSAGTSSIAGTSSVTGGSAGAAGANAGGDGGVGGGESVGGATSGGVSGAAAAGAGGAAAGTGGAIAGGSGGVGATAGAGGAAGADPGPLLKNGSFEGGGLTPWQVTVTPSTVGKAVYTQWGPGGESADGKYEVSFWNGMYPFTGDLHQVVTGLTPGKYRLTLYVAYGAGLNAAYLYAIDCGPEDARVDLPLVADASSFVPTSIPSINVTGDTCTVGIYADMNTGNWLNADDFVLAPLPPG